MTRLRSDWRPWVLSVAILAAVVAVIRVTVATVEPSPNFARRSDPDGLAQCLGYESEAAEREESAAALQQTMDQVRDTVLNDD